MSPESTCPVCQRPLPANAPGGLCPECLMRGGLGTCAEIDPATTAQGATQRNARFVPPPVEDIADVFPQLEVLEFIGQGGMGAVYRARQKQLDRVVALKILPSDIGGDSAFRERFLREAKAMARLSHPGIVTIHDFGQTEGGLFYFVMEFVDGTNLGELTRSQQVSPREALRIVPQVCEALQYAHDQGIVHRDIKPENILLDREGNVKVADFGLAKLVGSVEEPTDGGGLGSRSTTLTTADKVMGTPQYMAPEQQERPLEVDHRADVYSLGVVFYQLLTGVLPERPIEPPSRRVQVDVRLDEVVLRALEKEPERRYQHVSVLKTQVETIVATPPAEGGQGALAIWAKGLLTGLGRVPWQIWIVVAVLMANALRVFPFVPGDSMANIWFATSCLFVVGLVARWRWVFVLFLLEFAVLSFGYGMVDLFVALPTLVLVMLTASAWRFYFATAQGGGGELTKSQVQRPVLIGVVVFVLWQAVVPYQRMMQLSNVRPTQREEKGPSESGLAPSRQETRPTFPSAVSVSNHIPKVDAKSANTDTVADVADIPSTEFKADGNDRMRYYLIGPKANGAPPEKGYKLVIVLPGGDGGPDFNPFVRRILKHALSDEYLIAQPVAPVWQPGQQIVWPTHAFSTEGQEFATEDFVEAVVADVTARHKIEAGKVFSLSWSSGGPAGYATSLAKGTSIAGSYVAMSVFKPGLLPRLENAKGHAYFIDHSPEDRVCPIFMAKKAETSLKEQGAAVRLNTYGGGHGWQGDVYGRIRDGIEWLEDETVVVESTQLLWEASQ